MSLEMVVLGTVDKLLGTAFDSLSAHRPPMVVRYVDALDTSRVAPIMEEVERLEASVFKYPAQRWAYFHFALRTGFVVTLWDDGQLAGFQCVLRDDRGGCVWTTIVRERYRELGYAKMLSALSLSLSRWWGDSFTTCLGPGSISMIRRSLNCARLTDSPCVVVTANPFHSHTPKLVLRTGIPKDPWEILGHKTLATNPDGIPVVERIDSNNLLRFRVPPTDVEFYNQIASQVLYRERFALEGWCEDGTLVFSEIASPKCSDAYYATASLYD